jgi:hypothetical protein
MDKNLQRNLQQGSTWMRILYMVLFAFIYGIAEMVVFGIAVIQVLIKLVTGDTNPQLLVLGQGLSVYIYQMMQFFTFNTEERPFPFGPWPGNSP